RLDVPASVLARFAATLSPPELERAARFHFERLRQRFIAGRGLLRALLGRYLKVEPGQIEFGYGSAGKPMLLTPRPEMALHFNLAHTDDLALLAFTRLGPVGVDVERVRSLDDVTGLVSRFFSAREHAAFASLPEAQQPAAFFNLWTRKEAWLKATGEGIAHSLHLVEVSFLPREPTRLLAVPEPLSQGRPWTLLDLRPAAGFAAALAIAAAAPKLRCWRWESGEEASLRGGT
ncbi:MAG: 4'-phosphopantetheinyl transferase family protein, partial [Rudaea sp.]